MRNELMKSIRDSSVVHCILGRTILIKYLEDRKDVNGNSAFPQGFYDRYFPGAKTFAEVLQSKESTYQLFEYFNNKFHGDMFPITDYERNRISEADISLLRDFIMAGIDFVSLAHKLLGELPQTSQYLYDIVTIILVVFAFFIVILPLALICKNGRRI